MENTNIIPADIASQEPMFGFLRSTIKPGSQFFKKLLVAMQEFDALRANTKAFNYKYANLTQVMEIINAPLHKQGLMYLQPVMGNTMQTIVIDIETQEQILIFESEIRDEEGNGKMIAIQRWGSAITYTRRYSLVTAFNLSTEEDTDGIPPTPPTKNLKTIVKPEPQKIAPTPVATKLEEQKQEEMATLPQMHNLRELWNVKLEAIEKSLPPEHIKFMIDVFNKNQVLPVDKYNNLLQKLQGL